MRHEDFLIDYQSVKFDASNLVKYFEQPYLDWIRSCALAPQLNYDVTLETGEEVFKQYGRKFLPEDIEKVMALPWFKEGEIPDEIRRELVKQLDEESEDVGNRIRKLHRLRMPYLRPPAGSYAEREFERRELIDKPDIPDRPIQPPSPWRIKNIIKHIIISLPAGILLGMAYVLLAWLSRPFPADTQIVYVPVRIEVPAEPTSPVTVTIPGSPGDPVTALIGPVYNRPIEVEISGVNTLINPGDPPEVNAEPRNEQIAPGDTLTLNIRETVHVTIQDKVPFTLLGPPGKQRTIVLNGKDTTLRDSIRFPIIVPGPGKIDTKRFPPIFIPMPGPTRIVIDTLELPVYDTIPDTIKITVFDTLPGEIQIEYDTITEVEIRDTTIYEDRYVERPPCDECPPITGKDTSILVPIFLPVPAFWVGDTVRQPLDTPNNDGIDTPKTFNIIISGRITQCGSNEIVRTDRIGSITINNGLVNINESARYNYPNPSGNQLLYAVQSPFHIVNSDLQQIIWNRNSDTTIYNNIEVIDSSYYLDRITVLGDIGISGSLVGADTSFNDVMKAEFISNRMQIFLIQRESPVGKIAHHEGWFLHPMDSLDFCGSKIQIRLNFEEARRDTFLNLGQYVYLNEEGYMAPLIIDKVINLRDYDIDTTNIRRPFVASEYDLDTLNIVINIGEVTIDP